ncbi:MAG: cytochrome c oxidase assembly protein [Marinovum algicola]|jgi:cytochrome c oxidase assembly protein subunit 11|uniref:Cytochrome c oxidase assembly protein CtaG n=1 Tax=Marinovum algicola TaxID=42444 RepID=A0A975W6D9_9RHOB|nr:MULTISPECIES: cytochrome c oxidase assembly protein [Marinovum]AKO95751.1 Cytochrome oxidase assembly factor [Marinovum algicola DG 898]MDD9741258.1 cytochrome c oxidase assembly protein [Marinovum sp. SP66]MDD9743562.1 cytochrome c oxidase assembly protein [Marinovum sp. PR37]SEI53104.1 cytochrome c oxidase assembly protein subunit 11 [Marinovum algicola]SLN29714.1 Cytochrome c oxidase assembly protein CtaG [Marinovum algicola]
MALSGPAKTVAQTVSVVVLMGGLAWASVPFYDWFCRVTGFGGVTNVSETGSDVILDKTIKIRFDASLEREMSWEFKALQPEMTIRLGETGLAFYEAYNPTDRPIAGQASYNVAPYDAGAFFTKIECFCFTEQVLMPGERVEMPVTFYVDPEIVEDRDAKYTKHITLSYTFYEIDMPETAALDAATETTQTN